MSSRHYNTYMFLFIWLGVALFLLICLTRLPQYLSERKRLIELSTKLGNNIAIQRELTEFLDDIGRQTDAMNALMASYEQQIDSSEYERLNQSEIRFFIDDLPQLFTNAGAQILNLGYQPRKQLPGFEDLLFEIQLRSDYQSMRRVLYALETNPAGIVIDRLEFLNFDDEMRLTRLQLECSVRFKANES